MRTTAGVPGAKRVQRLSLIAAIGVGALAFTGCSAINQQSTTLAYAASDGVQANVGNVELRNLLIVADAAGDPGRVIGTLYNNTDSDVTLTISGSQGATTDVTVKPNVPLVLNGDSDKAILSSVTAAPGALETLQLSSDAKTVSVNVPVLDGTLQEYKDMAPTAVPSATP